MVIGVLFIGLPASAITLETGGNASGTLDADGNTGVSVTSETEVDVGANAEGVVSDDASGEGDEGEIVITVSGIDASADLSVKSAGAVQSNAELASYARNVVKASTDVRDITLSDTEVSVRHREYARILGIFPAKVFARATIASDGSVEVAFPWYSYAGAKKAELASKVEAAVRSSIPSVSGEAGAQAKLSAQVQARILEKATVAMKTQFEADAAAKAKVK